MHLPKSFTAAFAGLCMLFLFAAAGILIPAGIFMTALPCLALRLAGYALLAFGSLSAGTLLRIFLG